MAKITFLVVVNITVALCCSPCKAGPYVTAVYWPATGDYSLEFTVHNTLPSSRVSSLKVTTGDAVDLQSPTGWTVSQDFRQVVWYSEDYERQVQPGTAMGGFGFTLPGLPSTLGWWVLGDKGYTGYVTPVLIPEPSSVLALAAGLGALVLRRRRR